jgi:FdhD protein
MSGGGTTALHQVERFDARGRETGRLEFIREEPLQIRVDDREYAVVMRTPGQEPELAVGLCLAEGLIDGAQDQAAIGYDDRADPNRIDIWLTPERSRRVTDLLARRGFVSRTSCGICGKALIADLEQRVEPLADELVIGSGILHACLDQLDARQRLYRTTRGSHAALLFDDEARPLAVAEDVGRHNALDKVVGRALLDGRLAAARLVVLSSRNSYELVQKAARARLPVMVSNSRPTALAVAMGRRLGLTLAFPDGEALLVACGQRRIAGGAAPEAEP